MDVLLLAAHDDASLNPVTERAVTAAACLDGPVHILVAGENCRPAAEAAARLTGVSKVLLADHPLYAHRLAEPLAALLRELAVAYRVVLAPATADGKAVMPRLAALIDAPQISEIVRVLAPNRFERPIYAGSLLQTVETAAEKIVLTVRTSAFAPCGEQAAVATEPLAPVPVPVLSQWLGEEVAASDRPALERAKTVVAGGRGLATKEGFAVLERLAARLHAAVGASRAAVDDGLVPNECQIGQNGKVIAPDIYLAVGISGAIQHVAGLRDAKCIAAINKDEDAPIFRIADIGLVADFNRAIPEIEALLADYGF